MKWRLASHAGQPALWRQVAGCAGVTVSHFKLIVAVLSSLLKGAGVELFYHHADRRQKLPGLREAGRF